MKSNLFYSIIKKVSEWIEELLVKSLKTFLKSKMGGWFFSKVIDIVVDNFDEKILDPLIDVAVIKAAKKYDIRRAKVIVAQLEQAKKDNDEEAYIRHLDSLLGGM